MTGDAYTTWQERQATLGGETLRWAGKPGLENWDRLDPGAQLLIENALPEAGQRLLDLRCGTGLPGALAARRSVQVTLRDDSIVAVEAARRTLALYGVTGEVAHGVTLDPGQMPAEAFDAAWLNAPRGRAWALQLVMRAASALKPGGVLYLAGPNQGGIKSYVEDVKTLGSAHIVCIKRRYRLAACKDFKFQIPDFISGSTFSVVCRGQSYQCAGAPGVFAQGELDEGTRVLIETMQIEPGNTVLDLGCGCGVVGLVAARMGGRVYCVDHSAVAVETTRRTMALNGVTGVTVWPSDCASAARGAGLRFDRVITNPPFHQGVGVEYDVARQFIRDAAQVIAPGGALYLVANRFIRYEPWLAQGFTDVTTVFQDNRYRVFKATR
jgi:16S rRNA (guanine1207-N2)-methyltransferase